MKNLIFIVALFLGFLLMASTSTDREDVTVVSDPITENSLNQDSSQDIHHQLDILSSSLLNSKGIPSQYNSYRASQSINYRILKNEERTHHFFFMKEKEEMCKLIHSLTIRQITNFSSLLCQRGYHIYGLRKIII